MTPLQRLGRRWVLLLTDPHPPPWAMARVWCIVLAFLWMVIARAMPEWDVSPLARTTYGAYKQPDGSIHWGPYPGLPAEHFRVHVATGYTLRPGRDRVEARFSVERVPLHPGNPGPILDSDVAALRRLAAAHLRPREVRDSGEWASSTAMDLVAAGRTVYDRSRPSHWVIIGFHYAVASLVLMTPVVGFVRYAQLNWFDIQARRAARGHCPQCDYDLHGARTGTCPECGAPTRKSSASAHSGSAADPGTSPPSGARSRSPAS